MFPWNQHNNSRRGRREISTTGTGRLPEPLADERGRLMLRRPFLPFIVYRTSPCRSRWVEAFVFYCLFKGRVCRIFLQNSKKKRLIQKLFITPAPPARRRPSHHSGVHSWGREEGPGLNVVFTNHPDFKISLCRSEKRRPRRGEEKEAREKQIVYF